MLWKGMQSSLLAWTLYCTILRIIVKGQVPDHWPRTCKFLVVSSVPGLLYSPGVTMSVSLGSCQPITQ